MPDKTNVISEPDDELPVGSTMLVARAVVFSYKRIAVGPDELITSIDQISKNDPGCSVIVPSALFVITPSCVYDLVLNGMGVPTFIVAGLADKSTYPDQYEAVNWPAGP